MVRRLVTYSFSGVFRLSKIENYPHYLHGDYHGLEEQFGT